MRRHSVALIPFCWAVKQALQKGYHFKDFKGDLGAAFVVSLIALPLSMALSITIGLPPQHGIYTAIVAGIAAALFGGSLFQISGPTAAFVVILIPIIAEHGLRGLIWCQIMAGFMLIVFSIAKIGRIVNYIPYPVTTGFTAGIALVLATLSLKDFFGLEITQIDLHFTDKIISIISHLGDINVPETIVGISALVMIIGSQHLIKWFPSPIVGVLGGTLVAIIFSQMGYPIATIGSEFTYLNADGIAQTGIPPFMPSLHIPTFDTGNLLSIPSFAECRLFFIPAFILATLAALESLLSASIADSLTGTRHHSNAELSGIGIANILSGLATGLPATAALARTATNIHNGAKSPFAAIMHSLFILIYVLMLAPIMDLIPMSVLASLLLITAYNMSHLRQFMNTLRIAPTADRMVLVTCFVLTVFIDMVAGITIGFMLATILFLKRVAADTHVDIEPPEFSTLPEGCPELPKDVMLFKIEGPLFFGNVEKAYDRTTIINSNIKYLIIDMERVPFIDLSGMVAMKSVLDSISYNRVVYLCGNKEVISKILQKLSFDVMMRLKTTYTTQEAITHVMLQTLPMPTIEEAVVTEI